MHCAATGEVRVDEHGIGAGRRAWGSALIGLLLGIAVLLPPHPTEQPGAIPGLALQLAACALAGTLAGWSLFRALDPRVDGERLARSFLGAPMVEVVQHEHRRQVVQQTSLANVIGSCRRLLTAMAARAR